GATITRSRKVAPDEAKDIPAITIGQFKIGKLNFDLQTIKGARLKISGKNIFLDELISEDEFLRWNHVSGAFNDLSYQAKTVGAFVKSIIVDNGKENSAYDTRISSANDNILVEIPAIHLVTDFRSTDLSNPGIRSLVLDQPVVTLKSGQARTREAKEFTVPLDLDAALIEIHSGKVSYSDTEDSIGASVVMNLSLRDFSARQDLEKIRASGATFNLQDLIFQKPRFHTTIDSGNIQLDKPEILASEQLQPQILTGIDAGWWGANAKLENRDSSKVSIKGLDGGFARDFMQFGQGDKFEWQDFLKDARIFKGSGKYDSRNLDASVGIITWNGPKEALHAQNFSVLPKLSMAEAFRQATWQADYMTLTGESLDLQGLRIDNNDRDTVLHVNSVVLDKLDLMTARDKRLPLKRGVEKLMPTQFINNISYPFEIDSVILRDSKVQVREFSLVTNQQGTIPLDNVNALITNIKSKSTADDSLRVVADARLFNNFIDNFRYSESYRDSLSTFSLHFNASPMIFSSFSKATRSLAAIQVKSGKSDTLYADWVGNKYAAIGKMNFVYKGLSVRLLDKKNPERKSFVLGVVNFLLNKVILKRKNHREAIIFFERDKEKFVFNYWVKTTLNGVMSSIGLKRNKKEWREFAKKKAGFGL
ncbi:MAG: hypothetical protein ABI151_10075, partial [Chitinophagaceae bacterium]